MQIASDHVTVTFSLSYMIEMENKKCIVQSKASVKTGETEKRNGGVYYG